MGLLRRYGPDNTRTSTGSAAHPLTHFIRPDGIGVKALRHQNRTDLYQCTRYFMIEDVPYNWMMEPFQLGRKDSGQVLPVIMVLDLATPATEH